MLRLVSKYLNARLARVSGQWLYIAGGASLFRPVADRNEKSCWGIRFLAMLDAREWGAHLGCLINDATVLIAVCAQFTWTGDLLIPEKPISVPPEGAPMSPLSGRGSSAQFSCAGRYTSRCSHLSL